MIHIGWAGLAEGAGIPGTRAIPFTAELPRLLPEIVPLASTTAPARSAIPSAAKSRSPSRRPRLRLAAATGLALGSGVTAWWTRKEADRAYERYLAAAGPRRQLREFSRAERYDRAAGVALLGMEAGLLLATYWLFY